MAQSRFGTVRRYCNCKHQWNEDDVDYYNLTDRIKSVWSKDWLDQITDDLVDVEVRSRVTDELCNKCDGHHYLHSLNLFCLLYRLGLRVKYEQQQ